MALKEIIKLAELDKLLHQGCTGDAKRLAKRIGVSRSTLFLLFQELKNIGAEIEYDSKKRSYYYKKEVQIFIAVARQAGSYLLLNDLKKVVGGVNYQMPELLHRNICALPYTINNGYTSIL